LGASTRCCSPPIDEQEWDAVIRVHLKGTFAPSRHAAAYWRDRSKKLGRPVKARIITTTSTSGIFGNVGQKNYGAAKAAIAAFTIIAARELRRYGVTVNAVSPSAQTRTTEGSRVLTPKERALRDPEVSIPDRRLPRQRRCRGHYRPRHTGGQASFGRIAVCEGLRRGAEGAEVVQVEDPATAGTLVRGDGRRGAQEFGDGRHGARLTRAATP
jgi:NAD(P)-dependent dehydrogenase (short-subunit alcohol dehydrogenase family)